MIIELLVDLKARGGSREKGDILTGKAGPAVWGRLEHKPTYIAMTGSDIGWPGDYGVVKITDFPAEKVGKLKRLLHLMTEPNPDPEADPGDYILVKRRAWGALVDAIPASFKRKLVDDGEVEVTVSQIRDFVTRKLDGFTLQDLIDEAGTE